MKLLTNSLYIVSTPIGNLDDITLRAIEVLKNSDIIVCEDTRRSIKLLNYLNIKKKLIPYHKFNEKKQMRGIIEHIKQGKILSLISDAGTPMLSDPGRVLLNECLVNNIKIIPIPGISSITAAMSVSGFNDQFLFYGFLPKTEIHLEKILMETAKYDCSLIFFIPAQKINFYIKQFKKNFQNRKILIAREITKIHETFYRDYVSKIQSFKNVIKGEVTVVISEPILKTTGFDEQKIINKAKKFLKKYSLKDTVNLIIKSEKVNKKKVYDLCLKIKSQK